MKNIAIIIASIFLLGTTSAFAAKRATTKTSHKKSAASKVELAEKISNMLGYPSYILDGTSEAVMISYSVDENNIIHVGEISSSNIALKQYVLEHLDGKKMKRTHMEGQNGVMKVHFNGNKNEKLHFQY
ncbi:hypothetical protein [Cytophaga aurantiaca]|uniref:hypothetical protein n=1 Tax=Cytophaga aurantiaca TaxID=29530 RepID=UPI00037EA496|nr:hypothetical protein [Cytophaga aurantiaca]